MEIEAPAPCAGAFLVFRARKAFRLHHSQRAFTVFELVLALGLAAVIAVLALSAYETFIVRTEVSAAVEGTLGLRRRIESAYTESGSVPADSAGLRAAAASLERSLLDSLEVVDGRIDLQFGSGAHEAIRGRRLALTPYETVDRDVVWICGNAIPGVGLNALGLAAGGRQAVQIAATIEARYLPAECR